MTNKLMEQYNQMDCNCDMYTMNEKQQTMIIYRSNEYSQDT